ncbi:MAG TPA: universal stress protein [Candidatus Dormibacteraeota bacterium]|nr:universal stress protein [Candidatus Dormibacteraeota bacterium]
MKSRRFGRILIATDGSEPATEAASIATNLAQASGACVRVVHVWNLEVHHRHGVWDVETRAEANQLIDSTVKRLRALGLEVDGQILHADNRHIAAAVADAARTFAADLIVVGSRGLSDWASLLTSQSVSHELLTKVECPVLIVRGPSTASAHRAQRVLVAIAGDEIEPSVDAAIALASAPGSSVIVVHVPITLFGSQGYSYVEPDDEMDSTITRATKLLREAGVPAESMVTHDGPVAKTVIEAAAAWGADIIVIGSSRMGDLGSLVLGSVTHSLLRTSERPVLVAERVAR